MRTVRRAATLVRLAVGALLCGSVAVVTLAAKAAKEPSVEILTVEKTRNPQKLAQLGVPDAGYLPTNEQSELVPGEDEVFVIVAYRMQNPDLVDVTPDEALRLADSTGKEYRGIQRDDSDHTWITGFRDSPQAIRTGKLLFRVPTSSLPGMKALLGKGNAIPLP
jgi:hypothetical protein